MTLCALTSPSIMCSETVSGHQLLCFGPQWPPYPEWTSMLRIPATLLLSALISVTHRPSAIPTTYKGQWETAAHTSNSPAFSLWVFALLVHRLLVSHRVSHKTDLRALNEIYVALLPWSLPHCLTVPLPSLFSSLSYAAES